MNSQWYSLRWKIFDRDAFTCQYCGRRAPDVILHVDHIIPVSDGGTDNEDNLITSCSACNIGKNTTFLTRYKQSHNKTKCYKEPMQEQIMMYLSQNGAQTATELSETLGYNRSNVSCFLSNNKSLRKIKKGRNVKYEFIS